jgi:hypothetical protein
VGVPKIFSTKEGKLLEGRIALHILRRPYYISNGAIVGGKRHYATPIISAVNENAIQAMSKLEQHDIVHVHGVLTTKEVIKKSLCSNKHENRVEGNFVFVTAIDVVKLSVRAKDEKEGLEELKRREEISNSVMLIGSLCRNPELHETEDGKSTITQYQIAVNRKINLRAGPERTDYPWVKSYGTQAIEDSMRLQTGSEVLIDGAIQTRIIERKTVCEECSEEYLWKETVTDIYPYAVEYLKNCLFPEREESETAPVLVGVEV